MLTMRRVVTITGNTTIDEKVVCNHNANINCDTGDITHLHTNINDMDLYEANLETCREERAQFEDLVISTKASLAVTVE